MRSKKEMEKVALTREEELEAQVSKLKKALEYSELRNQGLMNIIEISSKEYGENLLKRLAPSSRQPLRQQPSFINWTAEWTIWQDWRVYTRA